AVPVEHRAQQPAAEAALLADLLLLTAQDRAQRPGIGHLRRALALEHLAGEEGQHDRREGAHPLPGRALSQAGPLDESGLRAPPLPWTPWRARKASTIGARMRISCPALSLPRPVAWPRPASARGSWPPSTWPRMPARLVCRDCAPPSTAPSRPPRSPAPEKSFCSAPNSASA